MRPLQASIAFLALAACAAPSFAQHEHASADTMPMEGLMWQVDDWHLMVHGLANAVYDHQGGPRGDSKSFSNSMLMVMGDRPLGPGTLSLRAMLSLDPAMGRAGYPLLLQTGETADGRTHLVDRQHPHDAFMELSGAYRVALGEQGSAFAYAGLPGEPALGPPSFMHRPSGMRIPEAPLTHHWLDSTHITMGVVTLGAGAGPWTLEASRFNGREPDQNRWNIEHRGFDSSSARLTFSPAPGLSLQASYGSLKSPETLEPGVRVKRTTASATWETSWNERSWSATLAWGRNDKSDGGESRKLDGWLLETTLEASERHTFFARAEQVRNDELFGEGHPLRGEAFDVRKLTVGYIHDLARTGPVRWGIGALASAFRLPAAITPYYGAHPSAYMIFMQARL